MALGPFPLKVPESYCSPEKLHKERTTFAPWTLELCPCHLQLLKRMGADVHLGRGTRDRQPQGTMCDSAGVSFLVAAGMQAEAEVPLL